MSSTNIVDYSTHLYSNDGLLMDSIYTHTLNEVFKENEAFLNSQVRIPSNSELSCVDNQIENLLRASQSSQGQISNKFSRAKNFIAKYS
jgi:hypothetical protein